MKITTKDFRIISETQFHFIDNEDVYLMLIRDGERICVELTTRTDLIARKYISNIRNARVLYDAIEYSLNLQLLYSDTKEIIDFAFHFNKLRSAIFALYVSKNTFTYKEHCALRRSIPFMSVFVFKNDFEETLECPSEIMITLKGDSQRIGSFIKNEEGNYTFIFSTDYE